MRGLRTRLLIGVACVLATELARYAGLTLEELAPKFATNMPIVWQASTNHLPKEFWIYKRLPRVFSAAAISNAVILAGFEKKRFPWASKEVVLWADHQEGEPRPPSLAILPKWGQISFSLGDRAPDPPRAIARDEAAVKRAWKCATLLGVDPAEIAPTNASTVGKYGISFARQVDGVRFPDDTDGFQIQFGTDGSVRQFLLNWPRLERKRSCATASSSEVMGCIRGHRAVVRPVDGETDYFGRVKALARADKLRIVEVRAYYMEGLFGKNLPENDLPKEITPLGELECVADVGTNKTPVQIYTPIVSTEVRRVLGRSGR